MKRQPSRKTGSQAPADPAEVERLRGLVKKYSSYIKELEGANKRLEAQLGRASAPRRKPIDPDELTELVRAGKTNRELASHFGVSPRTVCRRVREHGLTGVRENPYRTGRSVGSDRVSMERHLNGLQQTYPGLIRVAYPHSRFINERTKVCSSEKKDPEGEFTSVNVYYIIRQSGAYLLYRTAIRYQDKPVPFSQIYAWVRRYVYDDIYSRWLDSEASVEEIVGFTFFAHQDKPKSVVLQGVAE